VMRQIDRANKLYLKAAKDEKFKVPEMWTNVSLTYLFCLM